MDFRPDTNTHMASKWPLICATLIIIIEIAGCGMRSDKVILQRVRSKQVKLDAVVFSVDAGATTSTAYHIAIVQPDEEPSEDRSVVVMDRIGGPESISVRWSDSTLYIRTPIKGRVFKNLSKFELDGKTIEVVNIRYPTQ